MPYESEKVVICSGATKCSKGCIHRHPHFYFKSTHGGCNWTCDNYGTIGATCILVTEDIRKKHIKTHEPGPAGGSIKVGDKLD